MFSARHNKLSGPALEGYGLFIGETAGVWGITTYLEKGAMNQCRITIHVGQVKKKDEG